MVSGNSHNWKLITSLIVCDFSQSQSHSLPSSNNMHVLRFPPSLVTSKVLSFGLWVLECRCELVRGAISPCWDKDRAPDVRYWTVGETELTASRFQVNQSRANWHCVGYCLEFDYACSLTTVEIIASIFTCVCLGHVPNI